MSAIDSRYETSDSCQIAGLSAIYKKYLGYRNHGLFIEVGAFDGYSWSNVWGLAQAGWVGICYEPVPEYFKQCENLYKPLHLIKCVNMAMGSKEGELEMVLGGAGSTGDATWIKTGTPWGQYNDSPDNKIKVPMSTLDIDLPKRGLMPSVGFDGKWAAMYTPIDVISIDVEGYELEVLTGFSCQNWEPSIVIVEAHEKSPWDCLNHNAPAINEYFARFGYHKVHSDDVNNIYVSGGLFNVYG